MTKHIRDQNAEEQLFNRRIGVAIVLACIMLGIILMRYAYLQIWQYDFYKTTADNNRVRLEAVPPPRGAIYDRNGIVLAHNQATFSAVINRDQVINLDHILTALTPLLGLTQTDMERVRKQVRAPISHLSPITIKDQLSDVEIARLSEIRHILPTVIIRTKMTRVYPYGELMAHVVGYVGRINEKDEAEITHPDRYVGTDRIGKLGIEKAYEDVLLGRPGYLSYEADAKGRVVRKLGETDPIRGKDLHLSIDYGLQKIAFDQLAGRRGAIVALNPNTGEVLAFVSTPSFDPNLFVSGISSKDYNALRDDLDKPLYNRVLQGVYPPGSTIKPFEALGGLHYGLARWDDKINDPGFFSLPGDSHRFRDWKKTGHGVVNMEKAIAMSCDTYFYQLSYRMGIDRFHDWMQNFGFGMKTGIDLPYEKTGILPSSAWKLENRGKKWLTGETMSVGIGQGYFTATPLQVALATAMIANYGHRITPRVVHEEHVLANSKIVTAEGLTNPQPLFKQALASIVYRGQADDWNKIHTAMEGVIQWGTASNLKHGLIGYQFAGKTGTAQVKGIAQGKRYNEALLDARHYDHAWFMGFAPTQNPRIALAIIVENGKHGNTAAGTIARALFDYAIHEMGQQVATSQPVIFNSNLPTVSAQQLLPHQSIQQAEPVSTAITPSTEIEAVLPVQNENPVLPDSHDNQ